MWVIQGAVSLAHDRRVFFDEAPGVRAQCAGRAAATAGGRHGDAAPQRRSRQLSSRSQLGAWRAKPVTVRQTADRVHVHLAGQPSGTRTVCPGPCSTASTCVLQWLPGDTGRTVWCSRRTRRPPRIVAEQVTQARAGCGGPLGRRGWSAQRPRSRTGAALAARWSLPPRVVAAAQDNLERGLLSARGFDRVLRLTVDDRRPGRAQQPGTERVPGRGSVPAPGGVEARTGGGCVEHRVHPAHPHGGLGWRSDGRPMSAEATAPVDTDDATCQRQPVNLVSEQGGRRPDRGGPPVPPGIPWSRWPNRPTSPCTYLVRLSSSARWRRPIASRRRDLGDVPARIAQAILGATEESGAASGTPTTTSRQRPSLGSSSSLRRNRAGRTSRSVVSSVRSEGAARSST